MVDDRTELSDFLKSRRARLRPEDVGLRGHGGVRRVAGLRRDELARLAGVSIAHYTRLEQGNGGSVSDEVLNAIGTGLRLDADELAYLHRIARRPAQCSTERTPDVPEGLRYLLQSFVMTPAFLLGRHTQIVDWNQLAVAVFGDFAALLPGVRSRTSCLLSRPCASSTRTDGSKWRVRMLHICGSSSAATAETPLSRRTPTSCAT